MRFTSRQRLLEICTRQQAVLERQQASIEEHRAEIEELLEAMAEQQKMVETQELQQIRVARDLIERFREALDSEVDDDTLIIGLDIALVDLNDHMARLEEHHV